MVSEMGRMTFTEAPATVRVFNDEEPDTWLEAVVRKA